MHRYTCAFYILVKYVGICGNTIKLIKSYFSNRTQRVQNVYADDISLYISFKCKQPLEAILKVNSCLSDIMPWMITNK